MRTCVRKLSDINTIHYLHDAIFLGVGLAQERAGDINAAEATFQRCVDFLSLFASEATKKATAKEEVPTSVKTRTTSGK